MRDRTGPLAAAAVDLSVTHSKDDKIRRDNGEQVRREGEARRKEKKWDERTTEQNQLKGKVQEHGGKEG